MAGEAGDPYSKGSGATSVDTMRVVLSTDSPSGTPSGTQDVNTKQVNGVTVNVGIGVAGAGTQRVAVSSDSTVSAAAYAGAVTDGSGSITLGGTAQTVFAANPSRKYFIVQNLSGADAIWINFGVAAVQDQPSIKLDVGTAFTMENLFVSNESISIIGPTTGQKFTAKQG